MSGDNCGHGNDPRRQCDWCGDWFCPDCLPNHACPNLPQAPAVSDPVTPRPIDEIREALNGAERWRTGNDFVTVRAALDELAAARERIRADRDERKYLIELALRATERIHLDKDYWQVCGIQKCVCPEVREALANSRALVTPVPEGEKATAVLDEDGLCAACEGTKRMQRMVGHDAYGYIVVESTDIPCPDCMAAPVAQNTAACEWSQSGAYCLTHQSPARTCVAAPTEEAR